jgi:eukaryotic-like serine/threonine-protein kinase
LIAVLVTLLVALAVIAFFLVRSLGVFGGTHVSVPNVVGETAQAATQTLQNDNLVVGSTSARTSSVTKGMVISSDPKAGTKVTKNSHVSLVISDGPTVTNVSVPSVVGQQFTAATDALTHAGLTYKTTYVASKQPAGTVLSQDPVGHQQVKSTTVVKLTVSLSQTSVSVPNVVGITPAAAGSSLASSNLTLGTQTNNCSQFPNGDVASQSPAAGSQQPPSTPVNLVVSSGPCAVVPNVVGDSESVASGAVSSANLVPAFNADPTCSQGSTTPGNVESQTPAAASMVNPSSTVTMTVCEPSGDTTTTTTTSPDGTTTTTQPQGLL